ncbi:hypothetical protein PM082_007315 [Marasmius tenuissimus]|nr:hypothetical protein PM082_007315 [Marasmius tenuissimus]
MTGWNIAPQLIGGTIPVETPTNERVVEPPRHWIGTHEELTRAWLHLGGPEAGYTVKTQRRGQIQGHRFGLVC